MTRACLVRTVIRLDRRDSIRQRFAARDHRFGAAAEQADALGSDEVLQMWRLYLGYSGAGYRDSWQIVLREREIHEAATGEAVSR